MKAIVVHEHGGPEVMHLEDVPTPEPRPWEALVQVHAVSVNRSLDIDVRAGHYYDSVLPLIPGIDPAGQIVSLGQDVEGFQAGDRVVINHHIVPCGDCESCRSGDLTGCTSKPWLGRHVWGGYAEYVRLPASSLVKIPPEVSCAEACVIMRHFPTAIGLMRRAGLREGEWCLVMGAAGALGSSLVQLAKMQGAKVIAAAGAPHRVQAAEDLGADHGIDYRASDLAAEVAGITGGGVQVVFENIGDPTLWQGAVNSMAPGGRLATVGAHGGGGVQLDVRQLYMRRQSILGGGQSEPGDYDHCMQLAAEGKIKGLIDRVLPLSDARLSHELVAANEAPGKVILDPTRA